MTVVPDYRRVVIEACRPTVDGGRFAAKATVGIPLPVSATVFADGHDLILTWARWGKPTTAIGGAALPPGWREQALQPGFDDGWSGWITPGRTGAMEFAVVGIVDDYGSWLHDLEIKHRIGDDIGLELEEGAVMADARSRRKDVTEKDRGALRTLAKALRAPTAISARVSLASRRATATLMRRTIDRSLATVAGPYPVWVDRELGGFSSWYEFFPRSEGSIDGASGTFETAAKRLRDIAAMGFDIVYLPPIHPVGTTQRKGANNGLVAGPADPGSPWAIGAPAGGHTAVHPDLGTLADFDSFVAEARRHNLEVALDFAIQCSPDHPWVTAHPEWFRHRTDGSIKYAENPPKKYQDIYPINFETEDRRGLWNALRDVVLFWCARGVRVFRVDNPHTKPTGFWEWMISEVRRKHPDVIFLSEAFTSPPVMHRLAKVGFTQSYTYFTWRNAKWELTEYLNELAQSECVDFFRPNFWPNTPDILHATLQTGGPAAFRLRLLLAAFCAPSWGMYSGYELFENTPLRQGSEEYLHSEKYEYRPRIWGRPDSLVPLIITVNQIRRRHRDAVATLATMRVEYINNEALMCVSRRTHDRGDVLLLIVNLDPTFAQDGSTWLNLEELGLSHDAPFEAHDELTNTTFIWQGAENYVRLDPAIAPGHVLHLRPR